MEQGGADPDDAAHRASGREHLARARALAKLIAGFADRIEEERRLPEPLLAALLEAGLYRLLLPRACAGGEIDPVNFVEIIETVAKADASTAWCLCQAAGCSLVAAFLPPEAAATIFGRDPNAILAWGPGPGRAVAVAGGYRVTGKWSFASGGRHASWLGGIASVVETDGTPRRDAAGAPVIRTMLFPAAQAVMTDIWQVIGLRGTGSDAFAVTDLFVPAEFSVARDDQAERREAGPLYCFPTGSFYAAGFAGVALGLARSTLDAFIALATEKTPRGFKSTLRENAVIQSQVAQAEARLASARIFLTHSSPSACASASPPPMRSARRRRWSTPPITRRAPPRSSPATRSSAASATSTPWRNSSRAAPRISKPSASSSSAWSRTCSSCEEGFCDGPNPLPP